jgi:hypothetical protein
MTPKEFWKEVHRVVEDYETTGAEAKQGIGFFVGEIEELIEKWEESDQGMTQREIP